MDIFFNSRKPLVLSLFFLATQAMAIEVPIPEEATSSWIAENIVQNGVPTEILKIQYDGKREELLDFYRQRWGKDGDEIGFREGRIAEWSLISRLEDDELAVVQLAESDDGTTSGFVSISDYKNSARYQDSVRDFPKIGGTETVSMTESEDSGKQASTLILSNNQSVSQNASFYRRELQRLGWELRHDQNQDNVQILFFSSEVGNLEVAISSSGRGNTVIFSNMVKE